MIKPTLITALAAAALCAAAVGCGDNSTPCSSGSASCASERSLDIQFGDCSSFRRYTKAFIPEMLTVAKSSARSRHTLWAACFDAAPMRTLRWNPKIDFGELPKEMRENDKLAERFNLARAIGLRPKFEAMVEDTPTREPGSGQLEALEVAAQTDNVARVFMWTDAAINQIEGIRLATATPQDISRTISRWAPRLKGLAGVDLMFIGVGRGTKRTAAVRNAEVLFRGLADRVRVKSFTWTLELPANFDSSEA
jgi:hypothetical protein